MDTRSISTPYQSFGNDGNISCVEAITPSHLTINSTSVLRQHNCNFIPFSSGRDSFPISLSISMELTQLVSSKQDQTHNQTHSGEIQHSGRSIIQNKQTDFHRMVSQSKNCQCNFSHDQFSKHRSFATRPNHRLPLYVSPIPDEKALAIDAFTMNWNHIHAYAFPPFHLIPSVLNKIRHSQCRNVLVAPLWPNTSWFPELLNLLVSQPICLPVSPDLLEQLQGKFLHQNTQLLAIHACELSNNQLEIRSFQEKLQIMSLRQDEPPRDRSMILDGKSLLVGQVRGKSQQGHSRYNCCFSHLSF